MTRATTIAILTSGQLHLPICTSGNASFQFQNRAKGSRRENAQILMNLRQAIASNRGNEMLQVTFTGSWFSTDASSKPRWREDGAI